MKNTDSDAPLAEHGHFGHCGGASSDLACLVARERERLLHLKDSVAVIQRWLPSFERIVATTSNGNAVMTEIGRYASLTSSGDALDSMCDGISLRVSPKSIHSTIALDADHYERLPPSVRLFNRRGTEIHKTFMTSVADEFMFDSLKFGTRSTAFDRRHIEDLETAPDESVAPFVEIRTTRLEWAEQTLSSTLDHLIESAGGTRRQALPVLGGDSVWRIDRHVVPHFLRHLDIADMPYTRVAVTEGCAQMHHGASSDLYRKGKLLFIKSGSATLSFAPEAISECWVTTNRDTLAVECYDAHGRCNFAFAQAGFESESLNTHWRRLVNSLPRL